MATTIRKSPYFLESRSSRIGFKDRKSLDGGNRGVKSKLKVRAEFSAIALEK
jgi:hypothetical protein